MQKHNVKQAIKKRTASTSVLRFESPETGKKCNSFAAICEKSTVKQRQNGTGEYGGFNKFHAHTIRQWRMA